MSIGMGADWATRHGLARAIGKSEATDLLAETRERGMVHMGDNVQRNPTFICQCCGCCCGVIQGFKKFQSFEPMFSSNFQATIDPAACTGCGKCAKSCPAEVIDVVDHAHAVKGKTFKKGARVDAAMCLGCGVCHAACKFGALTMTPRPARRITPETTMRRILRLAIDQGKLHHMLLDDGDGLGMKAANLLVGAVLALPPAKQLLMREQVKSRFIDAIIAGAKRAGMKEVDI
jgi:ferredoxin